jgi:hypothetical protein
MPSCPQCVFPAFREVQEPKGPHLEEIEEHTPNQRIFRNYAGAVSEVRGAGPALIMAVGWRAGGVIWPLRQSQPCCCDGCGGCSACRC